MEFWAEATATSVYLINRSPTQALGVKTPYKVWHGEKPNVSHFKVFGSIVFTLILSQKLKKLDDKSVKCVMVGYFSESKAYRLFDLVTSKIILSKDVIFHENSR